MFLAKKIFKIRKLFIRTNKQYPSFFILIGLISGIIPFCFFYPYCITLIILGVFFIFLSKQTLPKVLIWFAIGLFLAVWQQNYFNKEEKLLIGSKIVKAKVIDLNAIGNKINWLQNPNGLKIKILKYKTSQESSWHKCNQKAMAYLKNKAVKYGDLLTISANISIPEEPLLSGMFNYKNFLRSQEINYIVYGKIVAVKISNDVYTKTLRKIVKLKENFLNKLSVGIKNMKSKTFLAGMILGSRQGVASETKAMFIKSGTAHILAISGLHVGVLALMLLLFFRFIPINIRFLLIPVCLFLYVLLTGLQPSALRAFIMISVFCVFRAFCSAEKSFNNILFAAVILIIFNPFIILSPGFQFSFIITGLLILTWLKTAEWKNAVFEKERWKNKKREKALGLLRKKGFVLFFTCLAAAFISSGLTMFYQGIFIPLMPILNFIIIPLLFPLFLLAIIKIILGFISINIFNGIINAFINLFVYIIFELSRLGSAYNITTGSIFSLVLIVILFYAFLYFFFFSNRKPIKALSLCLIFALIFFGSCFPKFSKSRVTVIKPKGENGLTFVYKLPGENEADIISLDKGSGYFLKDFLKLQNIESIRNLYIEKPYKNACRKAERLIKKFNLKKIVFLSKERKSKHLASLKRLCGQNHINLLYGETKNLIFRRERNKIKIEIIENGNQYKILLKEVNPGKEKIILLKNKNEINSKILTCSTAAQAVFL